MVLFLSEEYPERYALSFNLISIGFNYTFNIMNLQKEESSYC